MPRENSFSDSEGRSLTPDMSEDEGLEPTPFSSAAPQSPNPLIPIHPPAVLSPTLDRPTIPASPSKSLYSRFKPSHGSSQNSVKSPTQHKSHTWPPSNLTPLERFRAAVRKVILMHRGTSFLQMGIRRVGAEPGVNPRHLSANFLYGHIRQDCTIEVIDYSAVRSSVSRMKNAEFINMMEDSEASEREPWVKVRWINIGGLSWDVMKAVSIKYDLHPLAIEDIFHTRSQNRSKADYYSKHLFLRVLCHELGRDEQFNIVDRALEVIDEYHNKINKFERAVLLKPNVKTVRYLHILSGDLILHKRTLEPIKTLIYGLRRYDLDRCAALIDMSDPANVNTKVVGFMSHNSKIYLVGLRKKSYGNFTKRDR
ncbi:hypothetical protein DXG03_002849 [Asterophora parasitica]|uniref:Uncharacterized protein n=1 Tax=Asterophora parasitica TaxID=117018 RepID=A0A9P7KC09_9AGAR|nr:hypothetical protein DXG03_002849 [Asterophora parasitica]